MELWHLLGTPTRATIGQSVSMLLLGLRLNVILGEILCGLNFEFWYPSLFTRVVATFIRFMNVDLNQRSQLLILVP